MRQSVFFLASNAPIKPTGIIVAPEFFAKWNGPFLKSPNLPSVVRVPSGAINIGNDADAQAINIGTGSAARTMTVGNTTGATSVTINSGTGDIALTSTDKVTISASSGSQTDGTGGVVDFNGSEIENFKASIYEDSDNHSLTASENGKIIVFTSDSDIVLAVPTSLAIGFNCLIVQEGEGAVTITASGTTVRNRNNHVKTAGQYAVMSLFSYATNVFISSGDGAL